MKKFLMGVGLFTVIILALSIIVLITFGIRGFSSSMISHSEPFVLYIDFSQPIVEKLPVDPLQRLTSRNSITLLDLIRTIDHAAANPLVKGIVADFSEVSLGAAKAQEIRNAIQRFQESGKFTVAYADTYFGMGTGTLVYYLASVFDEIYMNSTGDVGFVGLGIEPLFFGDMLKNLGIVSYMDQRYEYKGVADMFNENGYTNARKESDTTLLNSLFTTIVEDVASSRKMTVDQVRELVDSAPFFGREAIDAGLVDGFQYWDQVESLIEQKVGRKADLVKPGEYLAQEMKPFPKKGNYVIALVYGVGQVIRGKSSSSMSGGDMMSSGVMMEAFRRIREDGDVDVVVFRIDSPGGSPVASATIDHEVQLTREAGIPVIVSMGDVAGSGGYYVAMSADTIFAQPMTLTGSIGVAGGKMVFGNLLNRLGIVHEDTHVGNQAMIFSVFKDPTQKEKEKLNAMMDRIYQDFTQGVMAGRKLTVEEIDSVARGRIWTGADAKGVKLVDELGGLYEAIQKARELAGAPEDAESVLRIYPRKKSLMEIIRDPDTGFFAKTIQSLRSFYRLMELIGNPILDEMTKINRYGSNETLMVGQGAENL
ncbi:MAG: signal peptide peptidase SppA [bacterium]